MKLTKTMTVAIVISSPSNSSSLCIPVEYTLCCNEYNGKTCHKFLWPLQFFSSSPGVAAGSRPRGWRYMLCIQSLPFSSQFCRTRRTEREEAKGKKERTLFCKMCARNKIQDFVATKNLSDTCHSRNLVSCDFIEFFLLGYQLKR